MNEGVRGEGEAKDKAVAGIGVEDVLATNAWGFSWLVVLEKAHCYGCQLSKEQGWHDVGGVEGTRAPAHPTRRIPLRFCSDSPRHLDASDQPSASTSAD